MKFRFPVIPAFAGMTKSSHLQDGREFVPIGALDPLRPGIVLGELLCMVEACRQGLAFRLVLDDARLHPGQADALYPGRGTLQVMGVLDRKSVV